MVSLSSHGSADCGTIVAALVLSRARLHNSGMNARALGFVTAAPLMLAVTTSGHPAAVSTRQTPSAVKVSISKTDTNPWGASGPGEVRKLSKGESFVPGVGAYWITAPTALATTVSAAVAAQDAQNAFGFFGEPSSVELVWLSNAVRGTILPNGATRLDDQHVLAWLVAYPTAPVIHHGPSASVPGLPTGAVEPPRQPATCPAYVFIDAGTGAVREAFQSSLLERG